MIKSPPPPPQKKRVKRFKRKELKGGKGKEGILAGGGGYMDIQTNIQPCIYSQAPGPQRLPSSRLNRRVREHAQTARYRSQNKQASQIHIQGKQQVF